MQAHWVVIVISTCVSCILSCSLPKGWAIKSLEDRAALAEMVFYGKVVSSPTRWKIPDLGSLPVLERKEGFYSAKIKIYCIFRGDPFPRHVNISGFGYLPGHCLENHAVEGEKGIFFVRYGGSGELMSQTVNVQKGVTAVSSALLLKIMRTVEPPSKKTDGNSLFARRKRGGCQALIHHQE